MARSMTGFGRAVGVFDGQALTVELSAVNHRFLDCTLRLPSAWTALEPAVKQVIRQQLDRGKITVTISRKRAVAAQGTVRLDAGIARQYVEASRELGKMLGKGQTLDLATLATMEGVFYQEETEEDFGAVEAVVMPVLTEALGRLNAMRAAEGEVLAGDVRHRIGLIREALANIEARLPELNAAYETRLRGRIEEMKTEVSMSEERIAIEVALLAEKGDVTEEVVRLKLHLEQMVGLLDSPEPVGRRLDFLTQEVQREVNTLGGKTRDADVAKDVIQIKAEVEKIREQIQNVE